MANLRISGAQNFPYSESDIRVNFFDPRKIIAAPNANITSGDVQGLGQFYSSDGGETWGQTSLPLVAGDHLQSDPAVDWTSDGTAWAIAIGIDLARTHLRLHAFRSTDGGATWSYDADPSGDEIIADKEMMWVDHYSTSPYKDNIYVVWDNGAAAVLVNRRTGPSGSWQTPIQVTVPKRRGKGLVATSRPTAPAMCSPSGRTPSVKSSLLPSPPMEGLPSAHPQPSLRQ